MKILSSSKVALLCHVIILLGLCLQAGGQKRISAWQKRLLATRNRKMALLKRLSANSATATTTSAPGKAGSSWRERMRQLQLLRSNLRGQTSTEAPITTGSSKLRRQPIREEKRKQQLLQKQRLQKKRLPEQILEKRRLDEKRLQEHKFDTQRLDKKRLHEQRLQKQRLDKKILQEQRLQKQRLDKKRLQEQRLQELRQQEKKILERRLQELRLEEQRLHAQAASKNKGQTGGSQTSQGEVLPGVATGGSIFGQGDGIQIRLSDSIFGSVDIGRETAGGANHGNHLGQPENLLGPSNSGHTGVDQLATNSGELLGAINPGEQLQPLQPSPGVGFELGQVGDDQWLDSSLGAGLPVREFKDVDISSGAGQSSTSEVGQSVNQPSAGIQTVNGGFLPKAEIPSASAFTSSLQTKTSHKQIFSMLSGLSSRLKHG